MFAARSARVARSAFRGSRKMTTETPTKGPRLPEGNDPASYHSVEHAAADTKRWAIISALFALPVGAFGVLKSMDKHEHGPAPIQYDYMRRANRSPRFPWGDDDLIGCPYEKHAEGAEH